MSMSNESTGDFALCKEDLMPEVLPKFLTTEDLASLTHRTPAAVAMERHAGKGPKGRRVGRRVLYSEADVTAWLESLSDSQHGGDAA